jgi:ankyrin repeat protein
MTRKLALVVLSMDVFWFAACRAVPDAPLAAAAARGDVARIRTLVGASGMVDQPDQNGITPLIWATRQGQLAAVRALVDAGADINGRDARPTIAWTVLMHAIHTNQPDAVHLLLESGANPNARNRELTPLSWQPATATPAWCRTFSGTAPTPTPACRTG